MKLRDVVIFVVGAAVGGLVATKIVSDKYEKIIKKEVFDLRESLRESREQGKAKKAESSEIENETSSEASDQEAKESYEDHTMSAEEIREYLKKHRSICEDSGYISSDAENVEPEFEEPPKAYLKDDSEKPYLIAPSAVGELGYVERRLIKYANGVITEEDEDIIFDIDDIIGLENLEEHIGDYEPRMLYIRNDKYRSDYILFECDDYYTEDIIETPRGYHD